MIFTSFLTNFTLKKDKSFLRPLAASLSVFSFFHEQTPYLIFLKGLYAKYEGVFSEKPKIFNICKEKGSRSFTFT